MTKSRFIALALTSLALISGTSVQANEMWPSRNFDSTRSRATGFSGLASVYTTSEKWGDITASGVKLRDSEMSAAHRSLPFGTMVRVTNRNNKRAVVVRIIDRGPFVSGRVIDLTRAAAHALGFSGLAPVDLAVVGHKVTVASKSSASAARP